MAVMAVPGLRNQVNDADRRQDNGPLGRGSTSLGRRQLQDHWRRQMLNVTKTSMSEVVSPGFRGRNPG